MDNSPRLNLPYMASSQAQKHVTHNEALRYLDCLVHITIKNTNLTEPPIEFDEGDCYFVADVASGDWTGKESHLACYQDGAWVFHPPKPGFMAWLENEDSFVVWSGFAWVPVIEHVSEVEFGHLGINTTPDPSNRLAVRSQNILFGDDGAGIQVKINKSNTTDIGSLLFQTASSGRVELGMLGSDNLSIKTSNDGNIWQESLSISTSTGEVSFPSNSEISHTPRLNLFSDGGRFAGSPEPQGITVNAFENPPYLDSFNGSVLSQGPAFIYNNSTYGGQNDPLDPDVDMLITAMKTGGGNALRWSPEFYTLNVTAGSGTNVALVHQGSTYYSAIRNGPNALPPKVTVGYWILTKTGEILLDSRDSNQLFLDGSFNQDPVLMTNSDGWHHVVRLINLNSDTHFGFYRYLFQIYANMGSEFLIAAPFLFFGTLSPQSIYKGGCYPGISAW